MRVLNYWRNCNMTLSELFNKADEKVAERYPDNNASIREMNSYRDGYIHGMTEKLEGMVHLEKVEQWLFENFSTSEHDGDYNYGQEYVSCAFDNVSEMYDDFLKTMGK